MVALARSLSREFRVVEPFQRGSGAEPLTVARHIADLAEVIEGLGGARPILVGSSWGAMLGLAYAATHPEQVAGLALIGCGTFDEVSRGEFRRELERRMGEPLKTEVERLEREVEDADERLRAKADLILPLYCHDAELLELQNDIVDAAAHDESWADMLRLQREGVYPGQFIRIRSPVLMLHGTEDPHPGQAIRETLEHHIPQLEYRDWGSCGHYPWVERKVKEEFFGVLSNWLRDVGSASAGASAR